MVGRRAAIQATQQKYCRQCNLLSFSQLKFPNDRHDNNKHGHIGGNVGYTHAPPVGFRINALARGRYRLPPSREGPARCEGNNDTGNGSCYDYAAYDVAGDTVSALDEDAEVCGQDRELWESHCYAVYLLHGVSAFGPVDDGLWVGGGQNVNVSPDAGDFDPD